MSTSQQKATPRRWVISGVSLSLALALTGCSGASIAGLKDVPNENSGGASVSAEVAQTAATRTLEKAAAAVKGKSPESARKASMVGTALRAANLRTKHGSSSSSALSFIANPAKPKVLAVSQGSQFPRYILAVTQSDRTSQLHVIRAQAADQPYQLFTTIDLAGGAQIPSLGALAEGTPVIDPKQAQSQLKTVESYASGMAWPTPKKRNQAISFADVYSRQLDKKAKDVGKSLDGKVGYKSRYASLAPSDTLVLRTMDGGSLVFTALKRTDTYTVGKKTKEIVLPNDLRSFTKHKKYKKQVRVNYQESLVMLVPAKGDSKVLGLREQTTYVIGK